jgi:putative ABC transport system ATP-binding protein
MVLQSITAAVHNLFSGGKGGEGGAGAAAPAQRAEGARPAPPGGSPSAQLSKPLGVPVVELFGVTKSYTLEGGGSVSALRDVSLHAAVGAGAAAAPGALPPVRRGEFVMIRGPSGGGKTTLLNLIGALDTPSSGTVRLFGAPVDFESRGADARLAALRLAKCGFVFQQYNLLSTLSA